MAGKRGFGRFASDEDGSFTLWNIFWTVGFLMLAALAIDTANAHRMRAALQATADSSALAAVMARDDDLGELYYSQYMLESGSAYSDDQRGKNAAIAMSQDIMGTVKNGTVLVEQDIVYGDWDAATGFTPGAGDYAQVTTRRSTANDNAVRTLLLNMFGGLQAWDIGTVAVAGPSTNPCITDGIITTDVIDFQSNNNYTNRICLHGEGGVEVNQNNYYEDGVIVSMPDESLLVVPDGAMDQNIGLEEALTYYSMDAQLAKQTDYIINSLTDLNFDSPFQPDYIKDSPDREVVNVNKNSFDPATMEAGKVYNVSCGGGGSKTLNLRGKPSSSASLGEFSNIRFAASHNQGGGGGSSSPTVIENVVIVTDCAVAFDSETTVQNAIIATTDTSDKSMQGSSGVSIGAPDNCTPGGGAQLVSAGGMSFAAQMQFHGSQLVSKGPIHLSAQVDGLSGTSIQSLGRVDLASNNNIGLCDGEADPGLPYVYFRLVE